jgi:hypothetical protein
VSFTTSQGNQLSNFQNGYFFKGTRMKPFSELFTNNFFGITFVAFICTQSIVQRMTKAEHNRPILKLFSNRPSAAAAEVFGH